MKKIYSLTMLTVFTVTSCKKDYQCSCVSTTLPKFEILSTTIHDIKKNAEKTCADIVKEPQTNSNGVKCELK